MDIDKKLSNARLSVRAPGKRAGGKKPSRQVLLRLDESEVESLEFYRQVTGGMSFARILKTCAIFGSLAFPYGYMLAKLDKKPENEFTAHLTAIAQEAAHEFGELMQRRYDAATSKEADIE